MPTLQQIAQEAGVSANTVSRVLTGKNKECWPSAIRRAEHIRAIAREMGYTPNHLARSLRRRKSYTIGLLWSMGGPHPSELMARRMALRAQRHGYASQIADHMRDPKLTAQLLRDLLGRGVDGVAVEAGDSTLESPEIRRLLGQFNAAVLVASADPDPAWEGDVLVHDRSAPLRSVVEHFVAGGRRRPAVFASRTSAGTKGALFEQHFCKLCPSQKAGSIDLVTARTGATAHDFWHMLEQQFPGPLPYDAVWCGTDQGAMAAIAWLRTRGLDVPGDVAVVGFNNSAEAAYIQPPVASIEMQRERVADRVSEMLFARLDDPNLPPQRDVIHGQFIWRPSAGAPAPEAAAGGSQAAQQQGAPA